MLIYKASGLKVLEVLKNDFFNLCPMSDFNEMALSAMIIERESTIYLTKYMTRKPY
jgi:hypothetical protein